jgi:hypothetical protein
MTDSWKRVEAPYSDAGWVHTLRYKLIKLLAGKSVILLNARFDVAPWQPGIDAYVEDCPDGCLMNRVYLPKFGGNVLKFSSAVSSDSTKRRNDGKDPR